MKPFKRIILIVLDSVGIGQLPDAEKYGDKGSNTLKNIALAVDGLHLPNLESLGLGNIENILGVKKIKAPKGFFGKMDEMSKGKDTITGHWEMMGIIQDKPLPVYPHGFPHTIIKQFEQLIEKKTIGNIPASGTQIIKRLGDDHVRTGYPIIYTSADSVFQIAAHEEIIPLNELYTICQKARNILKFPHNVGRVIARPFIGDSGKYERTRNRKDFSLAPPEKTVLDRLKAASIEVTGIGKISDIFCLKGITASYKTKNNADGMKKIKTELSKNYEGLIFTNLIDFDMIYGHRNNPLGYADSLKEFDNDLKEVMIQMKKEDLLIVTADHGCDPTTKSTDHSREYVPLIVYSKNFPQGGNLKTRKTFSDIGSTIAENFDVKPPQLGTSFLNNLTGGPQ